MSTERDVGYYALVNLVQGVDGMVQGQACRNIEEQGVTG